MARLLHARYPRTRFVIFGDGALHQECQGWVDSHNLAGIVHLPGLADNVWRALSAMDIFVLTSLLEGLPNVLIEAQAVGLPVVCSGAGGMREAFVEGKTGYSVPSASSDAFAGAVERVVEDDILRATMGAAGQQHARRMFSIERMIESTN